MTYNMLYLIFSLGIILTRVGKLSSIMPLSDLEMEKVQLRRDLDKITQDLLINDPKNHFYHSYTFKSGIGNREELQVELLMKNPQFEGGKGIKSWQSVESASHVYLLGRKLNSVTLVVSSTQLSNRSAQFFEHSLDLGANVSSTAMFTRVSKVTSKHEVIVVVAVNNPSADILWYRVSKNYSLELIITWSRYRRVSSMAAVKIGGNNRLIIVNTGSPATVDVFEVMFLSGGNSLEYRMMQSFPLAAECGSVTVCRVTQQLYLVFPLPESIAVYRLSADNSSHFDNHTSLRLPRVSQAITFRLAGRTYLAVNGDSAHVLRLTDVGDFIVVHSLRNVSEWLAVSVYNYRSDVVLFSKSANVTQLFVWTGTTDVFKPTTMPECAGGSCLDGDWSGAVSVRFGHQSCVLLPHSYNTSSLITVVTSLREKNNPIMDEFNAKLKSMKHHEALLKEIQSKLTKAEETLNYVIKRNSKNVITAKWKLNRLETPSLHLSSIVQPRSEVNSTSKPMNSTDVVLLQGWVEETVKAGSELVTAVEQREKEAWGLDGFVGKVIIEGQLIVDNLTVSVLNNHHVDDLFQNTFRRNKPQVIKGTTVVLSLHAENVITEKINHSPAKDLKFSDEPMVVKGNITFVSPVTVEGNVKLVDGGTVNGLDLMQDLCQGEQPCSVAPIPDEDNYDNNIDKEGPLLTNRKWNRVLSGKNLTVLNINGLDWDILSQSVVYKDRYQCLPGTLVVNGILSSDEPIWVRSVENDYQPSDGEDNISSEILEIPLSSERPAVSDRKAADEFPFLDAVSDYIFHDLVVHGTVTSLDSEWGAEAADVVLRDENPVQITADKTFSFGVSVTNNMEVEGLVGGVNVSDLLTSNTDQVFYGPTTLQGNISLGDVTLSGLLNRMNITSLMGVFPNNGVSVEDITADRVKVLETVNGVPVSDLVFTDYKGVTSVRQLSTDSLGVIEDITVLGKICTYNFGDFVNERVSVKGEQNITGRFEIKYANITSGLTVEKLNDFEMFSVINDLEAGADEVHLTALHVEGDITTDLGMNGHNLSDVANNAVGLFSNTYIEGHLIFKDEVTFRFLECKGYLNTEPCQFWLKEDEVVYKTNGTVYLSGRTKFVNPLNISGDLQVEEINDHKIDSIFTKTTDQEITGDVFIAGDVTVAEDSILIGLLNNVNVSELANRCVLLNDTISCRGNALFKETVDVENFKTKGNMNDINFDSFVKSMVNVHNPQRIYGFKNFTAETMTLKTLEVHNINNQSWDGFLLDTVTQNTHEEVESSVVFTETVTSEKLSVNYNLDAGSVNGVNLNEWRENAIYLNESFVVKRPMHFRSASSMGNLTLVMYGDLNMDRDIVRLHSQSSMNHLRFKSLTVTGNVNITTLVNGLALAALEKNTLKLTGNQTMSSDLVMYGDVSVTGNVDTEGLVNHQNLRDVVTLYTDQTLHGRYKYECLTAMENVTTSGLMSGVNMTEWGETAVLQTGDQEVTGWWSVLGGVHLAGPVMGQGTLADVDLRQLKKNITRDLLDIHQEMKMNLSSECESTNRLLARARSEPSELLYVDLSQEISVPGGLTSLTHFQSGYGEYLAISDKTCVTTVYKWQQGNGTFSRMFSAELGLTTKLWTLQHLQSMYLVSESSPLPENCQYTGRHLWVFTDQQLKHVSSFDQMLLNEQLEVYNNSLYSMNATGVFKWGLELVNGMASLRSMQKWEIYTDGKSFVPQEAGMGIALQDSTSVVSLESDWYLVPALFSNCTGEIGSVAASSSQKFLAVATTERTAVPRYSDHVKVYHQNGLLFDKLPAQRASHLRWLPVLNQTWLAFLQNNASLHLYHLQGVFEGFQQKLAAKMEATGLSTLSLPLGSKANPQPYLILQTPSSVKILRTVLQGDPYLGPDLSCYFDDVLQRFPSNL